MKLWLDYSSGTISGIALQASGITGVIRYVGLGGKVKRMTANEYQDLIGHGIQVYGVAEQYIDTANGGYTQGLKDAQITEADVHSITNGVGLPVVFACNDQRYSDYNTVEYVRGFKDVFGYDRTGAYGFGSQLQSVMDSKYASRYWLAGSPPSVNNMIGKVDFWQRQGRETGITSDGPGNPTIFHINGVDCDINTQYDRVVQPVDNPPLVIPPIKETAMYIRYEVDKDHTIIALLSGSLLIGLGYEEAIAAEANIARGALCQPVGKVTWDALDQRSHREGDNPRPVILPTQNNL